MVEGRSRATWTAGSLSEKAQLAADYLFLSHCCVLNLPQPLVLDEVGVTLLPAPGASLVCTPWGRKQRTLPCNLPSFRSLDFSSCPLLTAPFSSPSSAPPLFPYPKDYTKDFTGNRTTNCTGSCIGSYDETALAPVACRFPGIGSQYNKLRVQVRHNGGSFQIGLFEDLKAAALAQDRFRVFVVGPAALSCSTRERFLTYICYMKIYYKKNWL